MTDSREGFDWIEYEKWLDKLEENWSVNEANLELCVVATENQGECYEV